MLDATDSGSPSFVMMRSGPIEEVVPLLELCYARLPHLSAFRLTSGILADDRLALEIIPITAIVA